MSGESDAFYIGIFHQLVGKSLLVPGAQVAAKLGDHDLVTVEPKRIMAHEIVLQLDDARPDDQGDGDDILESDQRNRRPLRDSPKFPFSTSAGGKEVIYQAG